MAAADSADPANPTDPADTAGPVDPADTAGPVDPADLTVGADVGHAEIHPPHRESWDVATRLNYNREGRPTPLHACEVSEFGLYTERDFSRPHVRMRGMATWLLPDLGLRVISWLPKDGIDPRELDGLEDYYLDIASASVEGDVWRMVDYYLDVLVWTGVRTEVLDQDEFVAAVTAGHLDASTAEAALETSYRTVDGLAAHGHDLDRWLSSAYGIELYWP